MPSSALHAADAERLIGPSFVGPILVPTLASRLGGSMSLYRAGLKLALFLPLGVAMPPSEDGAVRFHRCELRSQPALTSRRDPSDRTPVRKR